MTMAKYECDMCDTEADPDEELKPGKYYMDCPVGGCDGLLCPPGAAEEAYTRYILRIFGEKAPIH